MTMTAEVATPRKAALERAVAMRLAATEYRRFVELLRTLSPQQWATQTECPGWDVRTMASHLLGMAEMSASMRENSRQLKLAKHRGDVFIDALTALQVEERMAMSPQQIVSRFDAVAPRAARGRRRTPWFVRRMSPPEMAFPVNGRVERWTLGYLIDTILTRDPWMHRIDVTRATGAELVHTPDHDGAIVDDVVREWAARHGQPCSLRLTGPAGGSWQFGTGSPRTPADHGGAGGPSLELDAVEFCRMASGRASGDGLLTTEVPF
ncbi:MAG: hypothetical protein QOE97_2036 [Pseudonocardiales bacterium]|jgi:uncharacterized protein (TIGR03083 family)|nr:hypothetical protein [Pseudonocardiales bacterium]